MEEYSLIRGKFIACIGSDKIKHCPFCGGYPSLIKGIRGSEHILYISCELCGASGEKFGSKFEQEARKEAIEAWNKRI